MDSPEHHPVRDRDELTMVLAKGLDEIRRSAPSLDVRLVGTAAAMLQGVETPVGDIDLLVRSRADGRRGGRGPASMAMLDGSPRSVAGASVLY